MDADRVTDAMRAFRRAVATIDNIRLNLWDEDGLTMTQLRLVCLLYPDQKRSVGDLADEMRVRPPTITGIADRLIKRGLVERIHDSEDRRVVWIALTENGRRAFGRLEAVGRPYLTEVFSRMGETKMQRLIDALDEFTATAEAVQRDSLAETA